MPWPASLVGRLYAVIGYICLNLLCCKLVSASSCQFYQRPVPTGAQDIGTWQSIFAFISVAAVITNAGLICFTMDVLNMYPNYGRLWIFVGFNWVLIAIQFAAQAIVDDIPEEVEIQLERMKFIHDKLILDVPDEDPSPVTGTEYTDLSKPINHAETVGEAEPEREHVLGLCACCMPKPVTGAAKGPKMSKLGSTLPEAKVESYPVGENALVKNPLAANDTK